VATRRIQIFYEQLVATLLSVPGRWPCTSLLHIVASTQDASGLVTASIEQHCIIKFLMEVKVKPAEILYVLNSQYEE
jgi:hypothetical protein